ncbi:hypothetical protein TCAL_10103 [Tigriopus californicus]|uniref:Uncharacterized protein n=2 Tax=Tigriopus californicus TaxID=6832 RepID=A0A553NYI2_TIGCA|nr:hypothetical protein TCAL_10103 [Tigriopus californicus]
MAATKPNMVKLPNKSLAQSGKESSSGLRYSVRKEEGSTETEMGRSTVIGVVVVLCSWNVCQIDAKSLHSLSIPSRPSINKEILGVPKSNAQRLEQLAAQSQQVTRAQNKTDKSSLNLDNVRQPSSPGLSVVTQSVLTFLTVFTLGCAILLGVSAWKRISDSSFRIPLPYQYSALSQFDQDPDHDINELEDNLHMLVEDSSSEGDDVHDRNGDDDDDEVFQSATSLGIKPVGAPKLRLGQSDSSNENEVSYPHCCTTTAKMSPMASTTSSVNGVSDPKSTHGFRQFTNVIVSQIPDSFAVNPEGLSGKIDLDLAREQHHKYVQALRSAGVDVTILPAKEEFPDCVFVEDVATIVEGVALVTKPGVASRRWETERIKPILKQHGLIVAEVLDEEATIDGGDVIFTEKEILVGLSKRTNSRGFEAVKEAFPGFNVVGVPVSGPLHLTTLIGLIDEDTLCVSDESGDSMAMFKRIQQNSQRHYKCVLVHDDLAANVILINGKLLCKSAKEHPKSNVVIRKESNHALLPLDLSEIEKAVGSLTCMSLRFRKPSKIGPAKF